MSKGSMGRPLLRRDIENAQMHSRSAAEAARYLRVSYITYKKYAKLYGMFKINVSGKGIPRPHMLGAHSLLDILDGKVPEYSVNRLKERMIRAGFWKAECALCGFHEVRPTDGRGPFTIYFKDGHYKNFKRDNIELRCFNCVYLTSGYVPSDIHKISEKEYSMDIIQASGNHLTGEEIERLQSEALTET